MSNGRLIKGPLNEWEDHQFALLSGVDDEEQWRQVEILQDSHRELIKFHTFPLIFQWHEVKILRSRWSNNRTSATKGLFTPKTRVFSAAEILLRIYQNPIHLNGTRWRTRFWRQREVRRRNNVVRQRAPFKCMGFWYIPAAEFPQPKKTRVFSVDRP